ncbi:MAG: response regulator [Verrucomicrobiae bacterium]|nr:response regulator [Verrucomicrobiae bacterium]
MSQYIIIAEDNADEALLLQHILSDTRMPVKVASDGEQALRWCLETRPAILLSDWLMPKMDGVELCKRVKSNPQLKDIFFIMVTALTQPEDAVKALKIGADEYIKKPFDPHEIRARVGAGLRIVKQQELIAELEHIKAIKQVAISIAHELNNPLTPVIGHVDLLKAEIERLGNPQLLQRLEIVRNNLDRVSEIVKQLCALDKPTTTPYSENKLMVKLQKRGGT